MTQLTAHFSLEELTRSSVATRKNIDNAPPENIIARLRTLAQGLEEVRGLLQLHNAPMLIDSGYRCEALNAAVGGSKTSAHVQGYAADFICPAYGSPLAIVKAIAASKLEFDQIIQEGTWVHISFDPRTRRQVLTAHFGAGGTTYTQGA